MMEIIDCVQGEPGWFAARLGIPTGSKFSTVMAKGKSGGTSKTRFDYMLDLIGEQMTGEPASSFSNGHMARGSEMEATARAAYCFQSDNVVDQVGFIKNGYCGVSPDGLIADDGMLEIKTRLPRLQLALILKDKVPPEHKAQIQGGLWIAERAWCDFVSYSAKIPIFIKRVYRDEEYISRIAEEVDMFNADMDELLRQLS